MTSLCSCSSGWQQLQTSNRCQSRGSRMGPVRSGTCRYATRTHGIHMPSAADNQLLQLNKQYYDFPQRAAGKHVQRNCFVEVSQGLAMLQYFTCTVQTLPATAGREAVRARKHTGEKARVVEGEGSRSNSRNGSSRTWMVMLR